jgi:hypothetical protein
MRILLINAPYVFFPEFGGAVRNIEKQQRKLYTRIKNKERL